ncbi:WD40/YVTN/BNR-like repeat-containing protein [Sulfobacillus thermosulfidooxidans]|uniref:WD40/YVTN/BNR-like repeat-containing protein n=1 Tax=Sulfobacillus thermosulfidooxidans TaxID=28034 RepID=UPI0006B453A5|nr:hypothetical protein [Sulfobacillus thermosulfidooxidans]
MKRGQVLIFGSISLLTLASCGIKHSMSKPLSFQVQPFRLNQTASSIRPVLAHATLSLASVQFFTVQDGEAIGVIGPVDGIFQTTNGGHTWQQIFHHPHITHLNMLNPQDGWLTTCSDTACSNANQLMKTLNGGKTWQLIYQAPSDVSLGAPDFLSATTGYIVETDYKTLTTDLMRTNNEGKNWFPLNSPLNHPGILINAVDFLTAHTGWLLVGHQMGAGAESKSLYSTHDGGQTWQLLASTGSLSMPLSHPPIPLTGYVDGEGAGLLFLSHLVGYLPLIRGPILMTRDGGRQFTPVWSKNFVPGNQIILSISFPSPPTGFVLSSFQGMNMLWRTSNRGKTWSAIYPPVTPNGPIVLTSHMGVGISTQSYQSDLLISHNDGMSWSIQHKFPTLVGTLDFGPHHSLWMTTLKGNLWYSLNQGRTFYHITALPHDRISTLTTSAQSILAAVKTPHGFVPMRFRYPVYSGAKFHWQILHWPVSPQWIAEPRAHDIWALGTNLAQSQASAQFSQSHPSPKAIALYKMQHPLQLFLYHKNTRGQWIRYNLPDTVSTLNPPRGLFFRSPQLGYFWTANKIFVTDNGGRSWNQISFPQSTALSFVNFLSSSEAWMSFDNGSHALFEIP